MNRHPERRPFSAHRLILVLAVMPLLAAGCPSGPGGPPAPTQDSQVTVNPDPKIEANRARLSPEDRALVEAQEWCVEGGRLGSMGTPVKVMVKGQPVFLCCDHCEAGALKDPDKTLAKVEQLKAKKAAAKASP
jgi:hypothetical protein